MDGKYVITIGHQLGCGGSEIGKKLSEALSIPFVDRQILKMVSDSLQIPESELENREERLASFWESFLRLEAFADPAIAVQGDLFYPSDKDLYELEKKYILEIAQKGPVILLGRGCRSILWNFEPHFSLFVYADKKDRIRRVSELYRISEKDAQKAIEKNDRERNLYMKSFPRFEWLDARSYDLCLNTSAVGIDTAVEVIQKCLQRKSMAGIG